VEWRFRLYLKEDELVCLEEKRDQDPSLTLSKTKEVEKVS
jgi:hypothetical protein